MKELTQIGTAEYEELVQTNKNYETLEKVSERLEAKVRYMLLLMNPLNISSQPFIVKLARTNYEIDVYAEFEDVQFVVECKSGNSHIVTEEIDKIAANKSEIQNYLRKFTKSDKPCLFLLIYSDNDLSLTNFKKAKEDKIDLWNSKILSQYLSLAEKLKDRSSHIIFSDLLAQKGKKWGRGNKSYNCLVTKGNYKGFDCYNFQMSPEDLLKIAYVHRRNFENSINTDGSDVTYQRMIDIPKIKAIQKFLSIEGNSFPTPILINFDKKLEFSSLEQRNAERRAANVTPGWLKFPEEYGYAWIIDGQHRLFGYSGLDQIAHDHMLNVIAFSQLSQAEQANLFVEINQNQKSIQPDYLWDLYTDIYPETDDKYKLARLVKDLNRKSVFFKDQIYIPSISLKDAKSYSLKINNIGVSFKSKVTKVYKLLLDKDIDKYYKFLDIYFGSLIETEKIKEDWEMGDKGFICSNNGVAILSYILNKFYQYLLIKRRDLKHLSQSELKGDLINFTDTISEALLSYGIDRLVEEKKDSSESGRREIAEDIILKAGELNESFKELASDSFISKIEEDLTHEFKETFAYNIKEDNADPNLFEDAILGTICAYINKGVEGHIYVGIRDNKMITGIDTEYEDYFDGNFDKLQQFFQSKLHDHILVKGYSLDDVILQKFKDSPLVLEIIVPATDIGVCAVRSKNRLKSWYKLNAKKIRLDGEKEDQLKLYLKDKLDSYNSLFREGYQMINSAK